MSWPRVFAARVRGLVFGSRLDSQLEDELRFHLEMQAEDNLRTGMNASEARYEAMRRFGGMESVKEEYREHRTFATIDGFVRDIRYAARTLRHSPAFTVVAVLTLAIGIGINATVFTVANAVLFKGFPLVERNDRLLYISSSPGCCVSWPDFEDWRAQAKSLTGMAIVHGVGVIVSDPSGFPEHYDATEVSSNTFILVGRGPIMGRDFTPADEIPGAAPVAILSYDFWDTRFGRDPAIVGRIVRMNGVPATVIGVMPQGFSFPQKQELWVPLMPTPTVQRRENRDTWFVLARMADGVTIDSARAEMAAIGKRLALAYPLIDRDSPPIVQNFPEFFIGPNAAWIYGSLWGAVGFVLLIACANLANLLLARAIGRSREISARIALGASRWRIVRQLLIESVMLSACGGVFGWWITKAGVRAWQLAMARKASWMIVDYSMDQRVLWYLVAISIGTGILFGLAPALRLSKLDVNETLKDGGRGATGGGREKHLAAWLVIAEMALAMVLLAAAGVMMRSSVNVYTDLGVQIEKILTASMNLPVARYPLAEARSSFFDRLRTRLEAIPGVESAAIASFIPTWGASRFPYELAGAPIVDERRRPKTPVMIVGPNYFRTVGASILSGRDFNDADGASGLPVAIVNERFANRHWPGKNPLGKRVHIFDGGTMGRWVTVVGVASNIVQVDVARPESNFVLYLPYRQEPYEGSVNVLVRTRIPPASLGNAFRREVHAMDADLLIYGPFTLPDRLRGKFWDKELYGRLFLIFAAIALLLASVGLYAVVAHSVSRRTPEIGIRMAIGATARDVLQLILRQGMPPVAIGLTIGLAASLALNRLLKAELVQVSPSDPLTFVVASGTLISAAMLGCLIPARRAMRVDPAVALRHD